MTQAQHPENPFAALGVGAQYALGRPYHHPRALARALDLLGVTRVDRALDVACGTGMSTLALTEVADFVIGADRSPEMLVVATSLEGPSFIRSAAEQLPFPDKRFDAITVCSGIHWFDQPQFFREARRLLRADGWMALYDHYFIGEMIDVPEFPEWTRVALERHPLPPRNHQVGDPRAETPIGYVNVGDEFYADDVAMTHQQFIDYELSLSPYIAAERRGIPREELRSWLGETTSPFFEGVSTRLVRFLGSLTCLRVATQ